MTTRTLIAELQTEGHLEADTLMMAYYKWAVDRGYVNILFRAGDGDIFIMILQHNRPNSNAVMDKGHSGKNNRRLIPMTELAQALGEEVRT